MIVIDFETYYASDYTLSKMTTEEYIRDPRFQTIGVAIKVGPAPAVWYPRPAVRKALKACHLEDHAVLAHNAMFDGAILNWVYDIRPGFWLDTLSMARPFHAMTVGGSLKKLANHYRLPEKGNEVENVLGMRYEDFSAEALARYGRYCCNDAEIAALLYDKLIEEGFPRPELASVDQTIRMFTEPTVELDTALLTEHLASERARKAELLTTVLGGEPTEEKLTALRSNPQFAAKLEKLGVAPPMKISPTTQKATYAFAKTDRGMEWLLNHPDEEVATLTRARLGVKSSIEESRAERLLGVSQRGTLPVDLNYYGAHTGRYSAGSKTNIQNMPSRGKSNALRRALKAPAGHVFLSADSSQIEARLLAWLAGQNDLTRAFGEGRDVYCEFAWNIFNRPVTKADKTERFVGKTGILSLGYSASGPRFQDMLRTQGDVRFDVDECWRIVNMYRERYPQIPKLWRRADRMLRAMIDGRPGRLRDLLDYDGDRIDLPSGFTIRYPGLSILDDEKMAYLPNPRAVAARIKARMTGRDEDHAVVQWKKIYGAACIENIVQALASCVIRRQARMMGKRGWRMAFQVHDDLVFTVPIERAVDCAADIKRIMSTTPKWAEGLPLACEVKVGMTYGEMEVVG